MVKDLLIGNKINQETKDFLIKHLIGLDKKPLTLLSYFFKNCPENLKQLFDKKEISQKDLCDALGQTLTSNRLSVKDLFSTKNENLKEFLLKILVDADIPAKSFEYVCIQYPDILKYMTEKKLIKEENFDALLKKISDEDHGFFEALFDKEKIYELAPLYKNKYAILDTYYPKLTLEEKVFFIKHLTNNPDTLPQSLAIYLLRSHLSTLKELIDAQEMSNNILDLSQYKIHTLAYVHRCCEKNGTEDIFKQLVINDHSLLEFQGQILGLQAHHESQE